MAQNTAGDDKEDPIGTATRVPPVNYTEEKGEATPDSTHDRPIATATRVP